jgi:4-hydroxybenzoyl-CoA reductase subunit beta
MPALPDFAVIAPRTVAEAIAARRAHGSARYLAGGTDVLTALRRGLGETGVLIDLAGIAELSGIGEHGGALQIGSGVSLEQIETDTLVLRHAPVLAAAARSVAGPAHRAVATLAGNLCLDTRCIYYNQSEWWRAANGYCMKLKGTVCRVAPTGDRCHAAYSGDMAPALLALDASVAVADGAGRREMPLAELYRDDGRAHLALGREDLIVAVSVPIAAGVRADYAKARLRGAVDFPLAGAAVALRRAGDALAALRVALTGTNSRPFVLAGTGELLGRRPDDAALRHLDKLVQKQVSPMRTTLVPAHYRRRVAAALTCRLTRELFESAPG